MEYKGFALGSNLQVGKMEAALEAYPYAKETTAYKALKTPKERMNFVYEFAAMRSESGNLQKEALRRYRNSAGEVEARDVANRAGLSNVQRMMRSPDTSGNITDIDAMARQYIDMQRDMGYSENDIQSELEEYLNGIAEEQALADSRRIYDTRKQSIPAEGNGMAQDERGLEQGSSGIQESAKTVLRRQNEEQETGSPVYAVDAGLADRGVRLQSAEAQIENVRDMQRVLREERKAWEQSAEIQQLIAERNAVRKENGMFNGVLKKWQEDHPEWQAYLDQRRAYNDRARRLVELEEQLTDQARNREAGRLEMQRTENEQARRAYEESVEQSGLTPAAYRQQQAEKVFGITESYEKAGFILPDGQMLDFSSGPALSRRCCGWRTAVRRWSRLPAGWWMPILMKTTEGCGRCRQRTAA